MDKNTFQKFCLYESCETAISNSTVINEDDMFDSFCFEVPHRLIQNVSLLHVRDIETNTEIEASSIDDKSPKPWIDIQTSALETKIGVHTYSFTFLNTLIGHRMCLYASYIIRSNHPDKPYIYMDRSEENVQN